MNTREITLNLPVDLVKRAQEQGLLNSERIASLLEAEIERLNRWKSLDKPFEPAREAFRAEHADMSEDEIMALINAEVKAYRAEEYAKKQNKRNEKGDVYSPFLCASASPC
jgi:hypothetical protein